MKKICLIVLLFVSVVSTFSYKQCILNNSYNKSIRMDIGPIW